MTTPTASDLLFRAARAYRRNQSGVLASRREPGADSYVADYQGKPHAVLVDDTGVMAVFRLDGPLLRRLDAVPSALATIAGATA